MRINPFIQFMKQVHGKINPGVYASLQGQSSAQHMAFLRQLQKEVKVEESLDIPLNELNAVVFDLETTGFFPDKGNEILSIGAVKVKHGKVVDEESFYSLAKCNTELTPEIKQLTGLKEEDFENAQTLSNVLIDFYKFVKGDVLVAHHASHEKSFLQHFNWKLFRTHFKHRIVDTSFLLKIAEPDSNVIRLEDCCEHCGIPVKDRHHALGDAKMTAELWCQCVDKIQEQGCKTLRDVYEKLSK
ncbi:exonuclease domain-containing protein [Fictibacillus phosphorivorans]|uniref:exonuclease domain-containing protein n=1 Tax=Fictibacillus phosphorivorans TaxID=1221500 RepID=UPI00203DA5DE|nr:exonuclease domain-containing protein [Fictibacillus phosphorivorans]MCM3718962.1 exonuclease domain-containing protein [Fictibacillus phosphorivorans]MCM3776584.1 exonuclease domain-containing protein [Fictibacillus phosphorivorans]